MNYKNLTKDGGGAMSLTMKDIMVIGRRWFDKINGNTYCAAKVFIDGKHVLTTDWTYGYGDFYQQLAAMELNEKDTIKIPKHRGGSTQSLWAFCSENNIGFDYRVFDGLKRELVALSKEKPRGEK